MDDPWWKVEAISNYITFVTGVLVTAFIWVIKTWFWKGNPNIIKVVKDQDESLLSISPKARQRLDIFFHGQKINELRRVQLVVTNQGREPIKDAQIFLDMEGLAEEDWYEVWSDQWPENTHIQWDFKDNIRILSFKLEFVNPYAQHKDKIIIELYTPKPIRIRQVRGRGLGWSTRFVDRVEQWSQIESLLESTTPAGAIASALFKVLTKMTR